MDTGVWLKKHIVPNAIGTALILVGIALALLKITLLGAIAIAAIGLRLFRKSYRYGFPFSRDFMNH